MKINTKKWKNIKWKNVVQYLVKQVNVFLLLVAFLMTSYCLYFWYGTIYKSGWSDLQKQNYIRNKKKEVVFNKNKFEKIVAEYLKREQKRESPAIVVRDIFQIKSQ